jgi:hypothetical protein
MRTRLGWVAKYADGRIIKQYPSLRDLMFRGAEKYIDAQGLETPIATLGAWDNYKLDRGLPVTFMVGWSGVNLVNGALCLEGKWKPAMPGTLPKKLIYYRVMRATMNGGAGTQCWHYVGYECNDHAIKVCIPDDGSKPSVEIDQVAADSAKPQGVKIG